MNLDNNSIYMLLVFLIVYFIFAVFSVARLVHLVVITVHWRWDVKKVHMKQSYFSFEILITRLYTV